MLELICNKKPLKGVTEEVFMNKKETYELIKNYIPDLSFSVDQLNGWIGKDARFGATKQKRIEGKKIRGRTLHVVREELRHKIKHMRVLKQNVLTKYCFNYTLNCRVCLE